MKYFALLLFFYFSALTVLPAVKVIKMHFAENCESSCHKKAASDQADGCPKEKCLLNFSINNYTFVLFSTNFDLKSNLVFVPQKNTVEYHKNFISHYNVTIWQPPESFYIS